MKDDQRDIVVVNGIFDVIGSRQVRFLEQAAKRGVLHIQLWADELVSRLTGTEPRFSQGERAYFLRALRYVDQVTIATEPAANDTIPLAGAERPRAWLFMEGENSPQERAFCADNGIDYEVIKNSELDGFPFEPLEMTDLEAARKKVVVTGCFDWLHSGHIRFFEETSALGDLYVVLGHDENVRLLKGSGHPQFVEAERRYMVQSVRHVKKALVSTGSGWMDAEPEIERIRPQIYAVNDDGDRPEKRAFCEKHGLDYVVLRRLPKAGLPQRTSTELRGF